MRTSFLLAACLALCVAAIPLAAVAGPPFLTDDPEPVDRGHFETYAFSQWQNQPGTGSTTAAPAIEFNWGFASGLQFHLVGPLQNVTAPGTANAAGYGDTEVGIKARFVTETRSRPQIGIFPMAELATGDAGRGLGNGQTWYRLPLWVQKSWDDGKWTLDTGGGIALNHAPLQRSYGFGGLLIQRTLGSGFTAGAEVYQQGATANGLPPTTFYNVGGYINASKQVSLLVSIGHSVSWRSQSIGYVGLYYTYPR